MDVCGIEPGHIEDADGVDGRDEVLDGGLRALDELRHLGRVAVAEPGETDLGQLVLHLVVVDEPSRAVAAVVDLRRPGWLRGDDPIGGGSGRRRWTRALVPPAD